MTTLSCFRPSISITSDLSTVKVLSQVWVQCCGLVDLHTATLLLKTILGETGDTSVLSIGDNKTNNQTDNHVTACVE